MSSGKSKLTLLIFLLFFIYAEVIYGLSYNWLIDENYSHGLLVPFVIGLIIWLEREKLRQQRTPLVKVGYLLIVSALLLLLFGVLASENFLQRISLFVMLVGLVLYFWGWWAFNLLFVPFMLFLFSIPLPQIIFNRITFSLQLIASEIAVLGIRFFGIPSVAKGNMIEILPIGSAQVVTLEVVEACSGIRSLMTLISIAILIVYFTSEEQIEVDLRNAEFWRFIVLLVSAVPVAVLTNGFRVATTGILTYLYGRRATEGFVHELSGWLVYILAFAILIVVSSVLKVLIKIRKEKRLAEPLFEKAKSNFALVFLTLVVGLSIAKWFEWREEETVMRRPLQQFPRTLGDWKQLGSDIRFSSDVESILNASDYVMRDYIFLDGTVINLYIGYYDTQRSGNTYHSPQNCLPGSGWQLKNPSTVRINTKNGKSFDVRFYLIENLESRELMLYWYQGRGRYVYNEYIDKFYTVFDKITRRRSDGAIIRITVPSTKDEETEKLEKMVDFSRLVAENLADFVPE